LLYLRGISFAARFVKDPLNPLVIFSVKEPEVMLIN
jgi:hypothetical protein